MKHTKSNWLDRVVMAVAPEAGLRRMVYRSKLQSYYAAADQGRTSEGWVASSVGAEQTNRSSRDIVRARARDLERNSDMMGALVLAMERNVVGTGIRLQAKVVGTDGEENDTLNSRIEEAWQEWCRAEHCDITGMRSFLEMQQLIVRRRFIDGGILVVKVYEKGQFCLQLLEVDCLDRTLLRCGEHQVVDGVEINAYGRPVAYHIRETDSYGLTANSRRVPADRVIYLPYLTRPGQVREFPVSAPSLVRVDDTNQLIDAAIEKEQVLSYFALYIENSLPTGGLGRGGVPGSHGEQRGEANETVLEQGTITHLAPGEKVSTVSPSGVSSTAQEIARLTQRLAASAMGLSYEGSRDMSQVNYSSARQGLLEDQRTYRQWQQYLMEHLCDNIYFEWLDWMVLSGRLALPGYHRDPVQYHRRAWIASGWDWIDPVKEANANKIALETCQKTLQEICAEKGRDWREVLAQRAMEQKMMTQLAGKDVQDGQETKEQPHPAGGRTVSPNSRGTAEPV